MTNDCKTCPVSTGTHKPAEAVHQIAEPAASVEKQIEEVMRKVEFMRGAAQFGSPCELDAARKGVEEKLRTLLSTPQPCSRSHPHEEMTPMCELRTEIARLTNALARAEAAAPQAVQDAVPLFWVRLLRDGLYEGPVHNNSVGGKMLRDEKPGEWHPLYLHAAPAHPAEGVPAQEVTKVQQTAPKVIHLNIGPDAEDSDFKDLHDVTWCDHDATDGSIQYVRADLATTHHTQQGLDAQTEAARSVLAERHRQIEVEGWKSERDDVYDTGEMALAAACYAAHSASCAAILAPHSAPGVFVRTRSAQDFVREMWPWAADWWKPSGHRRNLEKAGALILAEIERIDRACAAQAKQREQA